MERKLVSLAVAVLLVGGISAGAQQPGGIDPEAPPQAGEAGMEPDSRTAPMSTQQRQRIRAVILEQRAPTATISGRVAVGGTLPADVELHPVPQAVYAEVPSVRNYRYVYWNDRVVLVEPSSRKVVQIID